MSWEDVDRAAVRILIRDAAGLSDGQRDALTDLVDVIAAMVTMTSEVPGERGESSAWRAVASAYARLLQSTRQGEAV